MYAPNALNALGIVSNAMFNHSSHAHEFSHLLCCRLNRTRGCTPIGTLLRRRVQILKLLACNKTVLHRAVEPLLAWRKYDAEICIGGELNEEHAEIVHLELEQRELLRALRSSGISAGSLLKVLYDIGKTFEAIRGRVRTTNVRGPARDYEEG